MGGPHHSDSHHDFRVLHCGDELRALYPGLLLVPADASAQAAQSPLAGQRQSLHDRHLHLASPVLHP